MILELGRILYTIVLPIVLLASLGFLFQRLVGLDLKTLRTLNFSFVLPAIVFYSLAATEVEARKVGMIAVVCVVYYAAMAGITYVVSLIRKVDPAKRNTMIMTTIMQNAGNYGLTLQRLVFAPQGAAETAVSLQSFVMIIQIVLTFTVGIPLAAGGKRKVSLPDAIRSIAASPPIYAVIAGLGILILRRMTGVGIENLAVVAPFWQVVISVKNAFVAIALLTLGAQLGTVELRESSGPVLLSAALRLMGGPALAFLIIKVFGISGFLAQVLLIGLSNPTAVNCLLLSMEFDNNPDYAAKAVLLTTLLSPLTVTFVVYFAQSGFLG